MRLLSVLCDRNLINRSASKHSVIKHESCTRRIPFPVQPIKIMSTTIRYNRHLIVAINSQPLSLNEICILYLYLSWHYRYDL